MKTTVRLFFALLALFGLFAAGRKADAVIPPPDGGYPNFTTAEGTNALKNLTSGAANTAVGWYSLFADSTASFNTGLGAGTLALNNADSNTAIGVAALLFNTSGAKNTAVGVAALLNNTTATANTATGAFALSDNTSGSGNTADGVAALESNTEGGNNTAIGQSALLVNTTGSENTAIGSGALFANNTDSNTGVGFQSLFSNTTGVSNTAVGAVALARNTTGSFNTAVGTGAGGLLTGDFNICIGNGVAGDQGESRVIRIGTAGQQNQTFIAGIYGATAVDGLAVFVTGNGKLGTVTSSRRFKKDIADMDAASEALHALRPVTFHYKPELDQAGIPQYGLVAEEVAEVNPDLVIRDENGAIYSVRYDAVNAMLLNEFLKEHRKVEKLEATVADLAEQLQKITAHGQLNNSSARVAGK